jgi:hypothetical protein
MITKKVFPMFKNEDGKVYLRDGEVSRVTGTRVEYRFFGILLYLKIFYKPLYYEPYADGDEMQIDF